MKKRSKQRAGTVVYRTESGSEPLVLLITSRKYEETWVFPVGSVKKGETLPEAAARECAEESGYQVDVGQQLTPVEIPDGEKSRQFFFFLATVVSKTDQWEKDRDRKWVTASNAFDMLPDVFHGVAQEAFDLLQRTGDS